MVFLVEASRSPGTAQAMPQFHLLAFRLRLVVDGRLPERLSGGLYPTVNVFYLPFVVLNAFVVAGRRLLAGSHCRRDCEVEQHGEGDEDTMVADDCFDDLSWVSFFYEPCATFL